VPQPIALYRCRVSNITDKWPKRYFGGHERTRTRTCLF